MIKTHFKNKSLASPMFVFNFPEELQHYFWRGYSDGDGCFCIKKQNNKKKTGDWSLCGPYEKDWGLKKYY